MLSVTNNPHSLIAQHSLGKSSTAFKTSLERLSSGLKINRGADGPAALVISEKQRTQIAGLRQAIENTEKAESLVQTAEGALNEVNSLLTKIRSLAIDSANTGVNDYDALTANQAEIDNALETIDRIANNTQFGTKKLLNGDSGIKGVTSDPTTFAFLNATSDTVADAYSIDVTQAALRGTLDAGAVQGGGLTADETLVINGTSVELSTGMSQAQVIDQINAVTAQTGVIADTGGAGGATRLYTEAFGSSETVQVSSNVAAAVTSSGFGAGGSNTGQDVIIQVDAGNSFTGQGNVVTTDQGAEKGITLQVLETGADPTTTTTGVVGNVTVTDQSLQFQIGPNADQTASIAIGRSNTNSLGIGLANQFANLSEIKVLSAEQANDAIAIIDSAVDDITNLRGELGAFQANTLRSTANNLRATLENTINAESVIRDTDFAEEISNFTQAQVLQQAGTSVLSNANQIPQLVLSLLG